MTDCIVKVILTDAPLHTVKVTSPDKVTVKVEEQTTKIVRIFEGATGPAGPAGPPATLPPSLSLFLMWDALYPTHYKKFVYSLGVLTAINMYTDNTLTTQIFGKAFTYSLGVLTQIVVTRISDSSTETKNFGYSLGILDNIQVTQA